MKLFHFAELCQDAVDKIKITLGNFPNVDYVPGEPLQGQQNTKIQHVINRNVKLFYDANDETDIELCRKVAGRLIDAGFVLTKHLDGNRLILSYDQDESMILIPTLPDMRKQVAKSTMKVTPWEVSLEE